MADMLEIIWFLLWFVLVIAALVGVLMAAEYCRERLGITYVRLENMTGGQAVRVVSIQVICFILFLSAVLWPCVIELPKNLSGKSVATVEHGRLVYHPYGVLTTPWKWHEQEVVIVRDINWGTGIIYHPVRNKSGVVGITSIRGKIVSTDPEACALASISELPGGDYGQGLIWWAQREFAGVVADEALTLSELKPTDAPEEDPTNVAICKKVMAKTNESIRIYGLEVKSCYTEFTARPTRWGT